MKELETLRRDDPRVAELLSQRMDGEIYNTVSGLGTASDPIESTIFTPVDSYFDIRQFDTLVRRSPFAMRIADFMPNKMVQKWCKVTTGTSASQEAADAITQAIQPYRMMYRRAYREARINGGCVILRFVNDGRDAHEPVDYDNIREVAYSRIMTRWEVWPDLSERSVDPKNPDYYLVASNYASAYNEFIAYRWHKDRVIRFDGLELTEEGYRWSGGWGDSILLGMVDAIKQYTAAIAYSTRSLKSFEVLHLATDLVERAITSTDTKSNLRARWATIQATMSVLNMIVSSKQNEEVNYLSRRYSGVAEMLDKARQYLVDVSGMTKAQLFGEHPTGSLNSTGESISKDQALKIAEEQRNVFEPELKQEILLLQSSRYGPTDGQVSGDIGFEWVPLFEQTVEQKGKLRSTDAQTISTLVGLKDSIGKPIFLAKEIRALYAGPEYRNLGEIVLDEEGYQEHIEAMEKEENAFEFPQGAEMEGGEGQGPAGEGEVPEEGAEPIGEGENLEGDEYDIEAGSLEGATDLFGEPLETQDSGVQLRRHDDIWIVLNPESWHSDEAAAECEKGLSCGQTCIDARETCRLEGTDKQKAILAKLFTRDTAQKAAVGAAVVGAAALAGYLGVKYGPGAAKQARIMGDSALLSTLNSKRANKLIDSLPVEESFRSKVKQLQGKAKVDAFVRLQNYKDELTEMGVNQKLNLASYKTKRGDMLTVGSIDNVAFSFESQTDAFIPAVGGGADVPVYEMSFAVDFSSTRTGDLTEQQSKDILRRARASFRDHVNGAPDNAVIMVETYKGDSAAAKRQSIYQRAGFREIPGFEDYLFAVKTDGDFVKLDSENSRNVMSQMLQRVQPRGDAADALLSSLAILVTRSDDGEWVVWGDEHVRTDSAKECVKGVSCGDTCIASDEACKLEGTGQQKGILAAIFSKKGAKVAAVAGAVAVAATLGVTLGPKAYKAGRFVKENRQELKAMGNLKLLEALNSEEARSTINKLPVPNAVKAKIRRLQGKAKVGAYLRAQNYKGDLGLLDVDTKYNLAHFAGGKQGGLTSVSSIDDRAFIFRTNKTRDVSSFPGGKRVDIGVYDMGFNLDFQDAANPLLTGEQSKQIIGAARTSFDRHIQALPDNAIARVPAFDLDDADARRMSIYRQQGFRPLDTLDDGYLYAVKTEGEWMPLENEYMQRTIAALLQDR